MKKFILTHKLLSIIILCVVVVGAACAIVLPIALKHKHTYANEWSTNEEYHWHKATCEHTDEKKNYEKHNFGDWVVDIPAGYGTTGIDKSTCSTCGYVREKITNALDAKVNNVELKDDVKATKVYDGKIIGLTEADFTRKGDGAITISYKEKGTDAEFSNVAPKNVGEYLIKVSVAATSEWKSCETTIDYTITAKPLSANLTKIYDGKTTITGAVNGVLEGEDVTVKVTMANKNVGASIENVELEGVDKDNYSISIENVVVTVNKISIKTSLFNFSVNNNTNMKFALADEKYTVYNGDEVFVEVKNGNTLAEGTYILYADESKVADNIAYVILSGIDAVNYQLIDDEVGGNLQYTIYHESIIEDVVQNTNDYGWFEFETLRYTSNKIIIPGQSQGGFAVEIEYGTLKNKQFNVEIRVGSSTGAIIAKYARKGVEIGELAYEHIGVTFGSYSEMDIDLIKGVEGYTNEEGYWIYDGGIELYVNVEAYDLSEIDFYESDNSVTDFIAGETAYYKLVNGPMDETEYQINLTDLNGQIFIYDSFGAAVEITGRIFKIQSETGYIVVNAENVGDNPSLSVETYDNSAPFSLNTLTLDDTGSATDTQTYAIGAKAFYKIELTRSKLAMKTRYNVSVSGGNFAIKLYLENGKEISEDELVVSKKTVVYIEVINLDTTSTVGTITIGKAA